MISSQQNLGVFERFRDPLGKALRAAPLGSRHRIDRFWVMDRVGDPVFPYQGTCKRTYFAVAEAMAHFRVFVAQSQNAVTCKREVEVLTMLRGVPGVIQPLLIQKEGELTWIITDLYNLGDLLIYLETPAYRVNSDESLLIAYRVATAVSHCHEKRMVLRDLKIDNVLVRRKEDGAIDVVVTDFGLTHFLGKDNDSMKNIGTIGHIPPEDYREIQVRGRTTHTSEYRDLWALGDIFFSLQTKGSITTTVWPAKNRARVIYYLHLLNSYNLGKLGDLTRQLLSERQVGRPTARRVAQVIEVMIEGEQHALQAHREAEAVIRVASEGLFQRFRRALTCCLP
jgi:serine/threonine protein kinase